MEELSSSKALVGIVQEMEESPAPAIFHSAVRNGDTQERLTGETEVERTSSQGQIHICDSVALFVVQPEDKNYVFWG